MHIPFALQLAEVVGRLAAAASTAESASHNQGHPDSALGQAEASTHTRHSTILAGGVDAKLLKVGLPAVVVHRPFACQ